MGYSHYWTFLKPMPKYKWDELIGYAHKIIKLAGKTIYNDKYITIVDGHGNRGSKPLLTSESIFFNGLDKDACETFGMERGKRQDFCKTNQLPYDYVVVAILGLAKYLHGDNIQISTDGQEIDWNFGLTLLRMATDIDSKFDDIINTKNPEMLDK